MKPGKLNKNHKGFTLLETIVAVGVITVGLVAVLALINSSLSYVSLIKDRLIAAYLNSEGLEVARNIRDNNWLQSLNWNNNLTDGDYNIVYNSLSLSSYADTELWIDASSGLYNYSSGSPSGFKRKVSISRLPNGYEIQVISAVTWQRKGINYTNSAEDHLFNWK
jgi:prepilin-type N-terminal cleavage/methylation domain-containing protein